MSLLLRISPCDLGLPKQFISYRPGQADAIDFALSSDHRFTGLSAPTGIGKSLIGMTTAKTLGVKAVYLTVTKGLQGQILTDFRPAGLLDVRGRSNYTCRAYKSGGHTRHLTTCEEGADSGCPSQSSVLCPYFSAYVAATQAELVSTNYAYWLHIRRHNSSALGPVELLICDEAHAAFDQLASFLRVTLPRDEYKGHPSLEATGSGLMSDTTAQAWIDWASRRLSSIRSHLTTLASIHGTLAQARAEDPAKVRELELEHDRIHPILEMDSNWVWETFPDHTAFDPIWVAPYAHQLWSSVPRILLMSATLTRYCLHLLGLAHDEYAYYQCDNGWPLQNAPTYHLPTIKVNYRNDPADLATLVHAIDRIISARLDRKGLIHTVSYERMHAIRDLSLHRARMFSNDRSATVAETVRAFRAANPPAILVSPSFTSGWDFPYQQCEYQILPKVPWLPTTSRVTQERLKDPRYRAYCAALETVQMLGRSRRFSDDRSESYLLDNHFPWLLSQAKPYLPQRFTYHRINEIPKSPKRCQPICVKTA